MTLIPQLERQLAEAAVTRRAGRRRIARISAAAAIAVAVAAGLVALVPDASEERMPNANGLLGLGIPAGKEPRLSDLFAVFAREQTPRDDSGWTEEEVRDIPDRQPAEDPTKSRRVGPPDDPRFIWPMRDGVCSSFGNCLSLELLVKLGGVSLGTEFGSSKDGRPTKLRVHGIAVDGVEAVVLTRPDAAEIVVPVEGNTFERDLTDVRPLPTGARWEDAAGNEHAFPGRPLFPALQLPTPPSP
jgi:hypothetical protein